MEATDDDEDLKLVKASAGLLADLEQNIPKLFWKRTKSGQNRKRVHACVKKRDLDTVVGLIEPFQGEPQLLDSKLKSIIPPIVDAYLDSITHTGPKRVSKHVDAEIGACSLLYTLCKVRGAKVIVGFLNNEPRYLEPILEALERTFVEVDSAPTAWEVPYVLLMWLSHLLLAPFDLTSISNKPGARALDDSQGAVVLDALPPVASRVVHAGLHYLKSPTKAQDAAAAMLVRLSRRPDIQHTGLADVLVNHSLRQLVSNAAESYDVYRLLGSLRLISGVACSPELSHLIPSIYHSCEGTFDGSDSSALSSNAVAKKLVVKIFRNIAIISLHSALTQGQLLDFVQETAVLESVIDYLLRSLGDRDTPVRYAAAKAISLIVLELEPPMGHEVIQALLDSFKDDMPRSASAIDFSTTNPLKWHGLTLALAHTLFKRSASPAQLPHILDALIFAQQYEQRTATGSSIGTNVRDAANFGVWSVARRYTTAELLKVKVDDLQSSSFMIASSSIIQSLAIELILSACLDPAGNIRRGASAGLQELVGRHPNQVHEGIALVQVVDYQAVSLRTRALVDVANSAASLHQMYWEAMLRGLFGWRGLESPDVLSREGAARSLAGLRTSNSSSTTSVLQGVNTSLESCQAHDVEHLHGLMLAAACILDPNVAESRAPQHKGCSEADLLQLFDNLEVLSAALQNFSPRVLRSELPAAVARLITALCKSSLAAAAGTILGRIPLETLETNTERLLARHEEWLLPTIPQLAKSLLELRRATDTPLGCLDSEVLATRVSMDGSKSTLHSASAAIALGAVTPFYGTGRLGNEKAARPIACLTGLLSTMNVEWRVIGAKAIQLLVAGTREDVDQQNIEIICSAIYSGMNDYTIDERGDIGSLVRSQCISCASQLLASPAFARHLDALRPLKAAIYRLSLEKLDRVRLQAAQCRCAHLGLAVKADNLASISSMQYFEAAVRPMTINSEDWLIEALLEGCISCAGVGAESIVQNSREVVVKMLQAMDEQSLEDVVNTYCKIMKRHLADNANTQPNLELLAFLLDMQLPQRLMASATFKWRNLLAVVQKSHHKSNDIPKILAAVRVYVGLAQVPPVRAETLKKLVSMLKTNPYPTVRVAVAEALWISTKDESLKSNDWNKASPAHTGILQALQERILAE